MGIPEKLTGFALLCMGGLLLLGWFTNRRRK